MKELVGIGSISGKCRMRMDSSKLILCIALLLLVSLALLTPLHNWGDTATYYMQISSIGEDFDIQYSPEDINRVLENKFDNLPGGLFLTKTDDGRYFFSKEFSYAFFAAPFLKIMGNSGILVFNAILFWGMILIGYLYLRKKNGNMPALITSASFFMLSASFVYIFWVHPEIYNMFLISAGLFLWFLYYENRDYRYLLAVSFIFGIATVAKLPNIILFIPLIAFELYNQRIKNIFLMILIFSIGVSLFYGYFFFVSGNESFYGGERYRYDSNFPFIGEYNSTNEPGISTFSTGEEGRISGLLSDVPSIVNITRLGMTAYNFVYYISGRFTGMIWYYPLTLLGLFSIGVLFKNIFKKSCKRCFIYEVIKRNEDRFIVLSGICLYIAVFLIFHGNNYFGGHHAVGNRYFAIYPAFLFLIGYIDYRKIVIFIIISLIIIFPVISDPIGNSQYPYSITKHTPYKFLPIEYTQILNLPLWNNEITINSDNRWYIIQGQVDNQDTAMFVRGNSDFIVISDTEQETIQVMLRSETNNNRILTTLGGVSESVTLNEGESILLSMSGMRPDYFDNRYYLYNMEVITDGTFWMKPVNFDEETNLSITFFNGWHAEENWDGAPSRWMTDNATLLIYSQGIQNASLQFSTLSFYRDRTLDLYVNDYLVRTEIVPAWSFIPITTNLTLEEGVNEIRLSVPVGCDSPADIPDLRNLDKRCLSIGIKNISIIAGRI